MPAFFQMLNVTTQHYYPKGGMQGLTNAITDSMRGNGGVVKLRTEVSRIIVKNGHAVGVETTDGEIYHAGKVISNAAPHFTFGSLVERSHASPLMKDMINKRGLFESFCFVFLGMDKKYQEIREFDYIVFPDEVDLNINYRDYTPENSPLTIYRYPQQAEGTDYAVYLGTVLPYEYNNSWGTGKTGERGEEYNRIKLNAQETLIERVSSYLGEDFRKNIKTMFTATPITYERYTNATHGAMMGWSMQDWRLSFKETFLPFETAVKDLYLVGQFVFPGGGIPGALLSGMFLAKDLLSKEGIDLEKDFREVYRRSVALENAA
jgi:phytoene dehydrogenase-like protein